MKKTGVSDSIKKKSNKRATEAKNTETGYKKKTRNIKVTFLTISL